MTQRAWSWSKASAIAAVIGLVILLVGAVFGEGARRSTIDGRIGQIGGQVDDHEARLRQVESTIDGIAVDVRWLRRTEEARPR